MIPQDEHPDINFVGLLIGPRGNTLKCLLKLINLSSKCHVITYALFCSNGKRDWCKNYYPW